MVNKSFLHISLLYCMLSLFLISFYSCSSSKSGSSVAAEAFFPLTGDEAYSTSSDLNVKIPVGWFTAEEKECGCVDLWLIRNDYSATLNFVRLNSDSIKVGNQTEDSLTAAIYYSKSLKRANLGNKFKQTGQDSVFQIARRKFSQYRYSSVDSLAIRIVVFQYGKDFFELSALPTPRTGSKMINTAELYKVQMAVLSSIK